MSSDLLVIIERHWRRLKRESTTKGGEYSGPCPFCGLGTDRLRVWPNDDHPHYWCRVCEKSGDAVKFLMQYVGMSYVEAIAEAGPQGTWQKYERDLLRPRPSSRPDLSERQQEVLSLLEGFLPQMRAALKSERPRQYLEYRRIPVELAEAEGLMFLPREHADVKRQGQELYDWTGRIIAPSWSPHGVGYVGRMLGYWRLGMDEGTHKALLNQKGIRRYIKTARAGWFWEPEEIGRVVILVEGLFDRLALLAAGFAPGEVIAVGTDSMNIGWLPIQARAVIVAFDADVEDAGKRNVKNLLLKLKLRGVRVFKCLPPSDGVGKDASERWRVAEQDGIAYVFNTWVEVQAALYDGADVPAEVVSEAPECAVAASTLPPVPTPVPTMTAEQLLAVGYKLAAVFPGTCEVTLHPQEYTLEQRVQEIIRGREVQVLGGLAKVQATPRHRPCPCGACDECRAREALRSWAESQAWPHLQVQPWLAVGAEREGWELYLATHGLAALRQALAATEVLGATVARGPRCTSLFL